MVLFLCEYITALGTSPYHPLFHEGNLMRHAMLTDLQRVTTQPLDILLCCRHEDAPPPNTHDTIRIIPIHPNTPYHDGFPRPWHTALQEADIVLLIAPEHNDILYRLTQMAERYHVPLLTSKSSAIALTTSKTRTSHHLLAHHIPTPPIIDMRASTTSTDTHDKTRYCLKPDDGVGCLETFMAHGYSHLKDIHARYPHHIATLWIEGHSHSLTILCAYGTAQLITCNRQHIHIDNDTHAISLHAIDIGIPCTQQQWQRYQCLADAIAQSIPTLHGFIGIDIIDTGEQCFVADINPRITTSYIGLQHTCHSNPCDWLLTLHRTSKLSPSYPRPHTTHTIHLNSRKTQASRHSPSHEHS